jgi:hypothetical protein
VADSATTGVAFAVIGAVRRWAIDALTAVVWATGGGKTVPNIMVAMCDKWEEAQQRHRLRVGENRCGSATRRWSAVRLAAIASAVSATKGGGLWTENGQLSM